MLTTCFKKLTLKRVKLDMTNRLPKYDNAQNKM